MQQLETAEVPFYSKFFFSAQIGTFGHVVMLLGKAWAEVGKHDVWAGHSAQASWRDTSEDRQHHHCHWRELIISISSSSIIHQRKREKREDELENFLQNIDHSRETFIIIKFIRKQKEKFSSCHWRERNGKQRRARRTLTLLNHHHHHQRGEKLMMIILMMMKEEPPPLKRWKFNDNDERRSTTTTKKVEHFLSPFWPASVLSLEIAIMILRLPLMLSELMETRCVPQYWHD